MDAAGSGGGLAEAAREALLSALARLDDSEAAWQAVSELAGGKGGRSSSGAAIAALGSLLASGCGSDFQRVLDRMAGLPLQKASVLKEVVRVLGRLAPQEPRALQQLVAMAAKGDDMHRSPRMALLTALKDFYSSHEVRDTLQAAAACRDADIARCCSAVLPLPLDVLKAPGVLPALLQLFTTLLNHPDARVRMDAMSTWASKATAVPLSAGLPVATRIMDYANNKVTDAAGSRVKVSKAEAAQARDCAKNWIVAVLSNKDAQWDPAGGSALSTMGSLAASSSFGGSSFVHVGGSTSGDDDGGEDAAGGAAPLSDLEEEDDE